MTDPITEKPIKEIIDENLAAFERLNELIWEAQNRFQRSPILMEVENGEVQLMEGSGGAPADIIL